MRWNPLRWLRWLGTGLLSAATPLPWLVDVTAQRFDTLEARVQQLERDNEALAAGILELRDAIAPPRMTIVSHQTTMS